MGTVVLMMAALLLLLGFCAIAYMDGKNTGFTKGKEAVWSQITSHINTRQPMTLKFTGPGGLAFTTDYTIKELKAPRDSVNQRGGVNISFPTNDKKVTISVYRENSLVISADVDIESVPKSLLGKNLEAILSFNGWDL